MKHLRRLFPLFRAFPVDPAAGHHSSDLAFPTAQIAQLEALHLDLLAFTALLPGPDLLFRAIPIDHDTNVVGLAHFSAILLVHGTAVALEASVTEAHNVTGTDLIILRD